LDPQFKPPTCAVDGCIKQVSEKGFCRVHSKDQRPTALQELQKRLAKIKQQLVQELPLHSPDSVRNETMFQIFDSAMAIADYIEHFTDDRINL
jgi:hypothetical protein